MIEDMAIRKFAPNMTTYRGSRISRRSSAALPRRRVRLHLASSGAGTPTIDATCAALRFFFKVTLDRPYLAKHLTFGHEPRKVPVVLSPEEVARFLEAAPGNVAVHPRVRGERTLTSC